MTGQVKYSFRQLGELDHLDVDALCSLYNIELGGEAFYAALAERFTDDRVKELLRRNGVEEAGHARRVGRAISLKLGSDFEPTAEMLAVRPVTLPDDLGALMATLRDGELAGDLGYQKWAANEPDEEVRRLLLLNGREETLHAGRVEEILALLAAG
jgi:rubrerythrin